jgi:hypothetical protein
VKVSRYVGSAVVVGLVLAAMNGSGHAGHRHRPGGGALPQPMSVTSSATCIGADGGGLGALYDFAQLEQLWVSAGGPASEEQTAAAIALAESDGCSTDLNTTDNGGTQTSYGIWQESNGTHRPPVANILNPKVNAREAVAKYDGAGDSFSPWGTYDSGAYEQFLPG